MRVISGSAGGRKLKAPPGLGTRPTADQVKEAVFNIIQSSVPGSRVLDLFAGSGQMGIECLSRGASAAVFVDCNRTAIKTIHENLSVCGFSGSVLLTDSVSYLDKKEEFDLVFVDPPYDSGLYEQVLSKIEMVDILSGNGIIIVETRNGRDLPEMDFPYKKGREYRYGSVKICLYHREKIQ